MLLLSKYCIFISKILYQFFRTTHYSLDFKAFNVGKTLSLADVVLLFGYVFMLRDKIKASAYLNTEAFKRKYLNLTYLTV